VSALRGTWVAVCLIAVAAVGCQRDRDASSGKVGQDVKDVARATEQTAKDIGRATVDATKNASAGTGDAWITTKVKGELTREGFDPLHVHVDTADKVVTLSGSVESVAKKEQAVSLARAVTGVASVNDHLFVKPAER
jgi:hyperosmotically inducible protein